MPPIQYLTKLKHTFCTKSVITDTECVHLQWNLNTTKGQETGKIFSLYQGFIQCSYSFELFKFHDFFHDLFKFSKTLGLAVSFKKFTNFPCCRVFFDLQQFNRHKLWYPQQCMPFTLLIAPFCLVLSLP